MLSIFVPTVGQYLQQQKLSYPKNLAYAIPTYYPVAFFTVYSASRISLPGLHKSPQHLVLRLIQHPGQQFKHFPS